MRPIVAHLASFVVVACAAALALASWAADAHADPSRTPTLTSFGRRIEASEELRALVASLPPDARAKLPGIYVAFEESASDVSALAACDDDGDYVVVVSDALLVLVEHATHAAVLDEAGGETKLFDLADHYAWEQRRSHACSRRRRARSTPPTRAPWSSRTRSDSVRRSPASSRASSR